MTLLNKIKSQINDHKVISFDIFDTLLLRPYVKPTDLFFHLEKSEKAHGFAKARIEAEQKARQVHADVEDITLNEIYNEIDSKYKHIKQKETDWECQVLQPNPEMKEVFDYALKKNKKIIIVSDMYLPAKFLSDVLHKKGFNGYQKIYVSCEYRKTKWTGNLYRFVLDDLGISSKNVLHIGDNEGSDKLSAEKNGIKAVLYPKVINRLFEENKRAKAFYKKNPNELETSIILGMLTLNNTQNNYWRDFGYKYAGPVILGYMRWLEKQLKKDKISEVMFVARDGYTLEKVFNLIKTTDFKTHYFYAPRSMNLAINLNYDFNCAQGESQGLAAMNTLLHYFRNKDEFLRKNTPEIKASAEGVKFVSENRKLFEKLAQKEKKMYAKYFEQFKLKNQKIALIDTCSVFLSAQKAVISAMPDKIIKGYYWFTWDGQQDDIAKYKTQTYQSSHKQEFVDWGLMELFMTAPTPPVERIDNGKVIFKQITPNEAKRMEIYPDLSQGAVDFAQQYINVFGQFGFDFTCNILIDWVNIFCNIPTKIDKEHFVKLFHAWNQEHTEWQPLPFPWFTSKSEDFEPLKKITRFYLLGRIPLFKFKKTLYRWKLYVLHFIPLMSYKHKFNRTCLYLLGIPLFEIKTKKNKIKYSLFKFLPLISIKSK